MHAEIRTKSEYRNAIRSKAQIRRALIELMDEIPYSRVTITDIVKRADINRGTFYLHYEDIDDVLHHICSGVIDEVFNKLKELPIEDFFRNPQSVFSEIASYLKSNLDYCRRLSITDCYGFSLLEIQKKLKEMLSLYIEEHFECLGGSPDAILDYVASGVFSVFYNGLTGRMPISLDDAPSYLAELVSPTISLLATAIAE